MPYRPNANLNPTEAIYGFCAWLTTRAEITTMSHAHDCAVISELVGKFAKENDLPNFSTAWPDNLKIPNEESTKM